MMYIIKTAEDRARAVEAVRHIQATPVMAVEITEYRPNRSNAQNRLLWKWYRHLEAVTGNDSETLHEQMKIKVLGMRPVEVNGITVMVPKSTTKLKVDEMTRFLEAVEALGLQLGVPLSHDDEYNLAMGRNHL
jgi:hypothetical protein